MKEINYKLLFEMKQEDWMELCKDVDNLNAQLTSAQEKLKVAEAALKLIGNSRTLDGEDTASAAHARKCLAKIREEK